MHNADDGDTDDTNEDGGDDANDIFSSTAKQTTAANAIKSQPL